ncbi:MAG: DUF4093 domain-containing protein [Clostridia bacterium]
MISIREAIVVEGRYDKNKLLQIVDTQVIETSGFGIFNNAERRKLLQIVARARGLIVFTDSDSAGFVIRNHLRGILPRENVLHAYIPQIRGKERRKTVRGKEGLLGVEGVTPAVIIKALEDAGATFCDAVHEARGRQITKTDFYALGLSGGADSALNRQALLKKLDLPTHMTANALLAVCNTLFSFEEFNNIVIK